MKVYVSENRTRIGPVGISGFTEDFVAQLNHLFHASCGGWTPSFIVKLPPGQYRGREFENLLGVYPHILTTLQQPKAFLRSHTAHAYPEPLPTAPRRMPPMDPYHKFKQGSRRRGDMRVYNQKFDYEPQDRGQRMTCSAITNCYITHLTIETDNAVPMLVSGGFGYTYFFVIINGKPADRLSGRLRAYCMKPKEDPAIRSNRPMKMAFDTDSVDTSDDD